MNKSIWGGIIMWGIFVTCFGLGAMNPTSIVANSPTSAAPDQDVIFLLAGGIITCLIGLNGLIGFMGWVPSLSKRGVTAE